MSISNSFSLEDDDDIEDQIESSGQHVTARLLHELQNPSPSNAPRIHRRFINRGRAEAEQRLFRDYFTENPTYPKYKFRRRFCMRKSLFLKIVGDMEAASDTFKQVANATGKLGFHPIQKCTAVLRMLAYGTYPDAIDVSTRMSARVARESLDSFCDNTIIMYKPRYGCEPTPNDLRQLYAHHAQVHGFPGLIGSLDCMHWRWNACPSAWHGQYTKGCHGYPTVVLQAMASQDMWFWHSYFCAPGSWNDINILNSSDFYTKLHNGSAPDSLFTLRGTRYRFGYYLVDGVYTEHSIFVKTLAFSDDDPRRRYNRAQEKARKDIKRAFGVLKTRFHILAKPSLFTKKSTMSKVMYTCMFLHNMILENEGRAICQYDENEIIPPRPPLPVSTPAYFEQVRAVRSRETHHDLRRYLTDHLWTLNHLDLNMPLMDETDGEFSDEDHI